MLIPKGYRGATYKCYNSRMEMRAGKMIRLGDFIERNLVIEGADLATAQGFTQVPNFLLKSAKLSSGDKLAFAILLSYAWHNDYCFPGQATLAKDMGIDERSVRRHLKSLQANNLLKIDRRGLGKTNIYRLIVKSTGASAGRFRADKNVRSGADIYRRSRADKNSR